MRIYDERVNAMIALVGTIFTWLFGAWDTALIGSLSTGVGEEILYL